MIEHIPIDCVNIKFCTVIRTFRAFRQVWKAAVSRRNEDRPFDCCGIFFFCSTSDILLSPMDLRGPSARSLLRRCQFRMEGQHFLIDEVLKDLLGELIILKIEIEGCGTIRFLGRRVVTRDEGVSERLLDSNA